MNLKQLTKQHDDFAAMQARKAEREARKAEKEAVKVAKAERWRNTQATMRKTRELREQTADAAQQRRLDDAYSGRGW